MVHMPLIISVTTVGAAECAAIAFWGSVIIVLVKEKSGVKAASVQVPARAVMGWEVNCAIWLAVIING